MSATDATSEKWYQKYGWVLLFVIGIPRLAAALTHVAGLGAEEIVAKSPGAESLVRFLDRELGVAQLGFGLALMAIAALSYRRGERWAWYFLWAVPLWWLTDVANGLIAGYLPFGTGGLVIAVVFVIISLLGLLLPYRKFFPRR